MTHDGSTPIRPVADDAARGMPRLPWWAASLTLETGLLHMIAGSDHVRARWGYGVFFLVVALCQIIGGTALLVKSSRGLYLTGHIRARCPVHDMRRYHWCRSGDGPGHVIHRDTGRPRLDLLRRHVVGWGGVITAGTASSRPA